MKKYYEPFNVMFLPAYSSRFSAQERVWAVTKLELAKHFARLGHELRSQTAFEAEVDFVLDQIKHTYRNDQFVKQIRKDLLEYI